MSPFTCWRPWDTTQADKQETGLTLLSLSGLVVELFPQADTALSGDVGRPGRMVTVRPPGSVSSEAALRLGEVSEVVAAQARGALVRLMLTAEMWAVEATMGGGACGEANE